MKQKLLDLTKRLIEVPSEKRNTKALYDVLDVAKKELAGYTYKEYLKNGVPSHLYYNTPTLPKQFKVILNAHLDVVPAKPSLYKPIVKGDLLYGRGSCDMKSGAAAEILVYKELAKKVSYPLGLQLVTDEEVGGHDGTLHQIQEGVRADFVIAGEQTDLAVNNLSKGVLWIRVTARGKAAHSAYLWNGENAVAKLVKFINALYKTYPIPTKEAWRTTANVATLETSNKAGNKVPDECKVFVDIRYIPEDKDTVINTIKGLIPSGCELEIVEFEPSQKTDASNIHVVALSESIQSITGKTNTIAKHGASDIRHYDGVGCAGAVFGPVAVGLHQDDEHLVIPSLEVYYNILYDYLTKLDTNK